MNNKKRLNENYNLTPANSLWINGTTALRFNITTKSFKNIDLFHPLFMTNSPEYAFKYSQQHISKDYANNQNTTKAYYDAIKSNNALVVCMKLKTDSAIFDFTNEADFNELGLSNKFKKIFALAEPYFSWNSSIKAEIDSRPIEFSIALYYLRYLNSTAKLTNKTFYTDSTRPFIKILFSPNLKIIPLTVDEYKKFYQHYSDINWNQSDVTYDNNKKHHIKRGKNITVSEIPSPENITQYLELINTYLEFFIEFRKIAAQYKITSFEDTKIDNLKKLLGYSNIDNDIATYIDILQLVLYKKISEKFQGFYCPEPIAQKIYQLDSASALDVICLFSTNSIEKIAVYPVYVIESEYKKCKEAGIKGNNEILLAIKNKFDQRAAENNAREKQKEKDNQDKLALLTQYSNKIKTISINISCKFIGMYTCIYNIIINSPDIELAKTTAKNLLHQHSKDLSDAKVKNITILKQDLSLNIPLLGVSGRTDRQKEAEKALLIKSYHRIGMSQL